MCWDSPTDRPTYLQRQPLPRSFFLRPTLEVARDLLGAWLCRETAEGLTVGRIVETEAYGGPGDLASHARAGRTRRTTPMFGEVGHAYVYLVYGMHECLNVVAHGDGTEAGAVLLRAIEPLVGVDLMRTRRGRVTDPPFRLASGPARLCQAMAVDRSFDAHDLTTGNGLWLAEPDQPPEAGDIVSGPRVGVEYAGEWATRPWRFWLTGNPSASRR
ncbi:MAG: DNA-3-methyladenine glycosylase [Chloroflexota bacterium]